MTADNAWSQDVIGIAMALIGIMLNYLIMMTEEHKTNNRMNNTNDDQGTLTTRWQTTPSSIPTRAASRGAVQPPT